MAELGQPGRTTAGEKAGTYDEAEWFTDTHDYVYVYRDGKAMFSIRPRTDYRTADLNTYAYTAGGAR